MTTFILIDEDNTIKQQKARINRETLYKKCGFKTPDEFKLRHTWIVEICNIHRVELWARDVGDAENENKYSLPSPLNAKTYYGTIALVALNEKSDIISMNTEMWEKIYEHLYGDISSDDLQYDSDSDIDDGDASISAIEKMPYVKDDDESGDDINDLEDAVSNVRHVSTISDLHDEDTLNQIPGGSELEEEDYDYSDTE